MGSRLLLLHQPLHLVTGSRGFCPASTTQSNLTKDVGLIWKVVQVGLTTGSTVSCALNPKIEYLVTLD